MVDKDKEEEQDEFIRITFEGSICEWLNEWLDVKSQEFFLRRPINSEIMRTPIA